MQGSRDLTFLLENMKPVPVPGEFVFVSVSEEAFEILEVNSLLIYRELEGITLVLQIDEARKNSLSFNGSWALISLSVHSDLEAVGFLAAITNALADAGISTNVVSAFYHDHLFVPYHMLSPTLDILRDLAKSKVE